MLSSVPEGNTRQVGRGPQGHLQRELEVFSGQFLEQKFMVKMAEKNGGIKWVMA